MDGIIEKYRERGVIPDTSLMVLLAVGTYRKARIRTFKRTFKYSEDDFDLLGRLIEQFQRRLTTPNILTEADNLTRQLPSSKHLSVAKAMKRLIADLFEIHVLAIKAVEMEAFSAVGLTDCITVACSEGALLVTDDFRLSNTLASLGRDVININHIRYSG